MRNYLEFRFLALYNFARPDSLTAVLGVIGTLVTVLPLWVSGQS